MTKYLLLKDCTEIADRNPDVAKMPQTNDNQLDKHGIQNVTGSALQHYRYYRVQITKPNLDRVAKFQPTSNIEVIAQLYTLPFVQILIAVATLPINCIKFPSIGSFITPFEALLQNRGLKNLLLTFFYFICINQIKKFTI